MASVQSFTPDARAGRRRHSRLRVCLPARLITLDGTLSITLLDLSFRGGKVVGTFAVLRPGASAVLTWASFEAFCTLAWISGDLCGLDFDAPLKPNVLIATRDLADVSPRSDARRDAAREWVSGINR